MYEERNKDRITIEPPTPGRQTFVMTEKKNQH